MLIYIILFAVATITFCTLYEMVLSNDESAIKTLAANAGEAILTTALLLLNVIFSSEMLETMPLRILSVIYLSILLFNAFCDYKTKLIYRIYSYLFMLVSVIFAGYLLYTKYINEKITISEITSIGITLVVMILIIFALSTGKIKFMHTMGLADGFALVGTSMYLLSIIQVPGMYPVEYILLHFILSSILMIIFSITKFSIKKMKFTELIPFIPYIYVSVFVITVFFINYFPNLGLML